MTHLVMAYPTAHGNPANQQALVKFHCYGESGKKQKRTSGIRMDWETGDGVSALNVPSFITETQCKVSAVRKSRAQILLELWWRSPQELKIEMVKMWPPWDGAETELKSKLLLFILYTVFLCFIICIILLL